MFACSGAGRAHAPLRQGWRAVHDTISALHKSVRGSDPDAALYWLVHVDGGADPRYLARRLVRMASEDIGLVDPRAAPGAGRRRGYERLAALRASWRWRMRGLSGRWRPSPTPFYKAYNAARAFVKQDGTRPVPMHLRNAPTQRRSSWTTAGYRTRTTRRRLCRWRNLPARGDGCAWFLSPVQRGLEIRIADKLEELRQRNAQAAVDVTHLPKNETA